MSLAARLYHGEVSVDFVGRRRIWYAISAVVIALGIASMIFRGFEFGIDFKGGVSFVFPAKGHSISQLTAAAEAAGMQDPVVQALGEGDVRVQGPPMTADETNKAVQSISAEVGAPARSVDTVGASWGKSITTKALQGLVLFLIAIMVYISLRFEPKMALAAMLALVHDLVITAGVYSLVGFEVTPATVIALLTILGFSLYDTVVVFDKVRDNTAKLTSTSTITYRQAANLAVNQTLMRSINTSIIALLPVASLLFIGAGLLGAGTLKDLALAMLVGLAAGTYSSIFIATPFLAQLKEREPRYQKLAARVARQQASVQSEPTADLAAGASPDDRDSGEGTRLTKDGGKRPAPRPAVVAGTAAKAAPAGGARAGGTSRDGAATPRPAAAESHDRAPEPKGEDGAAAARPARQPARSPQRKGGRPGRPSGKRR
ncbi:MAG: protein translocase subunit SecF [Solirubrobacteraceae bacterium]